MTLSFIALVAVFAALLWQSGQRITEAETAGWITPALSAVGGLLLVAALVRRSISIEFVALTNTFEVLLVLAAGLAIVTAVYRFGSKGHAAQNVTIVALIVVLVLLALASSPLVPDDVRPPVPALRSNWLVLHVGLAVLGEALFAFAFGTALLYLFSRNEERRARYDRLTYRAIIVGYPLFTAGALVFGAVWAQAAWGRYWSWDPKETWALVTWLCYTAYLHIRLRGASRRTLSAVVAVVAFLVALFTFFGVNYLLGGLHAYG